MKKILIADDNISLRRTVKEVLMFEGFEVREAANGRSALEIFRNEHPDLVLMDLNMPEMNGIVAMNEMNLIDPSVPVIVLTGESGMISVSDALRVGAHYYLTKPPDFDELLTIINSALNKRKTV